MSQLKDIRTRLAANAATCSGIEEAHAKVVGVIHSTPAVVIRPGQIVYAETFEGAATYRLVVHVLVQLGDLDDAQDTLDDLLETSGTGSLIAALESDIDLNGEAHSVRVSDVEDYGRVEYGTSEFLGASVNVEVFA